MEHILENIGKEQYGFAIEIKKFLNEQNSPESELTNKLSDKYLKRKNSACLKEKSV